MVRLTCVLYRRPGMSPAEFHRHWREEHGPLITRTLSGRHVLRYEQHPKALERYREDDDDTEPDGVTVQWYESRDAYEASLKEPDFSLIWQDIGTFLDVERLTFAITDEPLVVIDGASSSPVI